MTPDLGHPKEGVFGSFFASFLPFFYSIVGSFDAIFLFFFNSFLSSFFILFNRFFYPLRGFFLLRIELIFLRNTRLFFSAIRVMNKQKLLSHF
jgi:hypothetical protein